MKTHYSTYAFTFRPRDGLTDPQLEKFCKYVRNRCTYYSVVTEKTGADRHLHAAMVMKEPCQRSNIATYLLRMYKDLDPEEKTVMQRGLKLWSSNEWLDYLNKGDDTVKVMENLPEVGYMESLFPQIEKEKKRMRGQQRMMDLEKLWYTYMPVHMEVNTENARDFLFQMMYKKRQIGLMDDKVVIQTAKHLVRWMNQVDKCTLRMPPFEDEE